MNTLKLVGVAILSGSMCVGCRSTGNADLESAVNSFYRAHQNHDWETVRSLVATPVRENIESGGDFASQWKKMSGQATIVSWRIIRIEPAEAITNQTGKVFRTVKVPMDVSVKDKDDGVPYKMKDQTDYWMLVDGKWQWFYTGYPVD